jgi:hypothetical protein
MADNLVEWLFDSGIPDVASQKILKARSVGALAATDAVAEIFGQHKSWKHWTARGEGETVYCAICVGWHESPGYLGSQTERGI